MVGCSAVVEDVLSIVRHEQTTRCAPRNPDIDPTIAKAHTSYGLAHATHEELVLLEPH